MLKPILTISAVLLSSFAVVKIGMSATVLMPETTATITTPSEEAFIPMAPQLDVTSYVLIDAESRVILAEHNADQHVPPASVTKMMTAYIVDQALARGDISKDQLVPISQKAAHVEGARILNENNKDVPLEDLLNGMVVLSGNDASIALAEFVAGSEENFSILMNQEAGRLGMHNTNFVNSNGLPDPNHYSSAHDLAILARALVKDFPETYPQYSQKEFTYNGIKRTNPNLLLWSDDSVDGIKTGYTQAAGYCLVSSAKRNDIRLIAVVMGAKSPEARAEQSSILLSYGFDFYEHWLKQE